MNKKGGKHMVYVSIIIFVVCAILIFLNFDKILMIIQPFVAETPCQLALSAQHMKAKIPGWTAKESDIRKFCSIGERETEIIFEKESVDDINEKIAKTLKDCIGLIGEGTVKLADPYKMSDKTICFMCATISFKGKAIETYEESNKQHGNSFLHWLKTNKKTKDQTYEQYFNQYTKDNIKSTEKNLVLYDIPKFNPKKDYKITYATLIRSLGAYDLPQYVASPNYFINFEYKPKQVFIDKQPYSTILITELQTPIGWCKGGIVNE